MHAGGVLALPAPLKTAALRPALVAGALAAVAARAGWRGADMPNLLFRIELFRRAGFTIWSSAWYGGHTTPGYSVLLAPLGAIAGPGLVGAASAVVAAVCFDLLLRTVPDLVRLPSRGGVAALRGGHRRQPGHRPVGVRAGARARPGRAGGPPSPPWAGPRAVRGDAARQPRRRRVPVAGLAGRGDPRPAPPGGDGPRPGARRGHPGPARRARRRVPGGRALPVPDWPRGR